MGAKNYEFCKIFRWSARLAIGSYATAKKVADWLRHNSNLVVFRENNFRGFEGSQRKLVNFVGYI
jgi:hypothetical protein